MIRFSKYIWVYFLLSGLVLIPGIFSLFRWGLRPALDFTGGTLIELKLTEAQKKILPPGDIQKTAVETYLLRIKPEDNEKLKLFQQKIKEIKPAPQIIRQEEVGPILGHELLQKTIVATILAMTVILTYVAYAFRNFKFGMAAIIALVHDLLVVLGTFSLLGHFYHVEVDTLFVTAFLTTMSFSVHDTIVVFDRIREYLKKEARMPLAELTDRALTETINRSLINSLTIIFMLLALFLMGGETIHWFVLALLVGTVSGAYSSPFIATPILLLWQRLDKIK